MRMLAHISLGLLHQRVTVLSDKRERDSSLDKTLQIAVAAFVLQPQRIELFGTAQQVCGVGQVVLRIVGIGVEVRHIHQVGDIVGILGILAAELHILLAERLERGVLLGSHNRSHNQRHKQYQRLLHASEFIVFRM